MKKLIFLSLGVASLSAFGATLTDQCAGAANGTVSFAFSTSAATVQCGDKQFSNFTGSATGTITINENSANAYELILKAPVGGISTAFTFGFTVSVDPGTCATCVISQIQQNMQTSQFGNTGQQIPNGSTATNTINNGGVFNPAQTNGLTSGGQNTLASSLNNTSYTLGFSYNPTGNTGAAGVFLNLDDVITQTPVPEPVSLSLTGLGLLGLGFLGRRRQKA